MMADLVFSLVGLQLLFSVASSNVLLDFQVDSSNGNIIFLECFDDGDITPSHDAIFEFFNPITQALQARIAPLPDNRLRYNVTPATEAVIHCFINDVSSQNLSIAAIPPSFADIANVVNVFRGTPTQLTCPFVLGNLRTTLTPYSISWEEGVMFPVPVTNSSQLSLDGTVLTVSVDSTDAVAFQCVLDLRRCNTACPPVRYRGPLMELQVFEPSRVTKSPSLQRTVAVGEMASFNCSGVGSFIRITWRFNNSVTCNSESCASQLLSYQEISSNNSNNLTIDSTLTIDTRLLLLESNSQQQVYSIECRVEQNIPVTLNLQGEDSTVLTNLRVEEIPTSKGSHQASSSLAAVFALSSLVLFLLGVQGGYFSTMKVK